MATIVTTHSYRKASGVKSGKAKKLKKAYQKRQQKTILDKYKHTKEHIHTHTATAGEGVWDCWPRLQRKPPMKGVPAVTTDRRRLFWDLPKS